LGVFDLPVGQPVPKRVERAVRDAAEMRLVGLEVAGRVRAARVLVSGVIGILARRAREARGQTARWAVGSEQDIGDGIAGLGSEEPGGEDRLRGGDGALEGQSSA